ncbi:hypothetical protein [Chitinophaga eiseniae]|uniref:DUF4932 domain-containing protein n=1 Tax=Chitinophaga eiseniae TaxID=634771 RepID=A0A847SLV4_9BACT|nr:hypothetical protein [Chitinophaga eiseniae]NLR80175.1 hypothetical protein [Chitinophaga eiseniae]
MKTICLLLVLLIPCTRASAQQVAFEVKYSEPLAVLNFVENLSNNAPDNPYKTAFTNSAFHQEKYTNLIAAFDTLNIDYSYEFTEYPYAQKIGGSTASLLKRNLITTDDLDNFKHQSVGIIPNSSLITLTAILREFTPVYREVIYTPNKALFEKQLKDITALIDSNQLANYFNIGLKFYDSDWDRSIPLVFSFYPLPASKKGFTATAFYNHAVSAIPSTLTDYQQLLSVLLHETFHILYDEQSLAHKRAIESWFNTHPSKNSRYAFLLLNEGLATALGNGYVYGQLKGKEDTASWYKRKYTNLIAKKIYPDVKAYVEQKKPMDKAFIDRYITLYDENFSSWPQEPDNLMTDRYVLTDNAADFNVIDGKFRYRSMSQYEDHISESTIDKMSQAPITKIVIISRDHKKKLQLVKNKFPELQRWQPREQADFSYAVFLKDKTYLLVINLVKNTLEQALDTLSVKEQPIP